MKAGAARDAAVVAISAIVETTLVAGWLAGAFGLSAFLACHALVTGGLAGWAWRRFRTEGDLRTPLLALIATGAGFAPGAVGVVLALIVERAGGNGGSRFDDWYFALFPESHRGHASEVADDVAAGGTRPEARVESFIDLVRVGTPEQKAALIALLARRFEPRFAPALRAALADTDSSTRVQAATAVARIEDGFVRSWMRHERAAKAKPRDSERARTLAVLLDDYAFLGLMDELREREVCAKALDALERARELAPDDPDLGHRHGRLLLRMGHLDAAAKVLEPIARQGSGDPELLGWYLEILFRTARYDECRRTAAAIEAHHRAPSRLSGALEMWRRAPEDRAGSEAA